MTVLNIDQWDIELVRATFFGSPNAFGRNPEFWRALVGSDPENVSGRPTEGLFTEEGPFGEGRRLVINGAVGRVDMLLAPQAAPVWPTIGKFGDSIQTLLDLINAHGELFNSAHRVALGIVANLRVNDRTAAYAMLANLLHDVNVRSDMHDLVFQVNYPKRLESYPITANRLCRWMSAAMHMNILTEQNVELGHMVRLEIDLNTFQDERMEMTDASLNSVFRELSNLAQEQLEQGNIH